MLLVLSTGLYASRLTRSIGMAPRFESTTRSGKKVTPTKTSSTGWTMELEKTSNFQNGLGPAWTKREYDICRARNAKDTWSESTTKACCAGPRMANVYRHLLSGKTLWMASSQSPTRPHRHGAIHPVVSNFRHPRATKKVIRISVWAVVRMLLDT
jgi:hypothetical protein